MAAIAQIHQAAQTDNLEVEDPTKTDLVRKTYRGIRNDIGTFQEGKAPYSCPPCGGYWARSPTREDL